MHWIHATSPCPTEQLWFKHSYSFSAQPTEAFIEVASGGRFILYVNGRNVTTSLFEPGCMESGDSIGVVRYDVKPFLRHGTNMVAVWYSPLPAGSAPSESTSRPKVAKQLSLELFGSVGGKKFAHFTDESWVCQSAFAHTLPNGDEIIDGRYHINGTSTPLAFRKQVERLRQYAPSAIVRQQPAIFTTRVNLIRDCHLWEDTHIPVQLSDSIDSVCPDSNMVVKADSVASQSPTWLKKAEKRRMAVGCGNRFEGRVRVTLQKMNAGDQLSINGLSYVCNGKDCEQACRRFTVGPSGYVEMEGPSYFNLDNILGVEAMDMLSPAAHYVRPYPEDRESHQPDETVVFYDNDGDEDAEETDLDASGGNDVPKAESPIKHEL